MIVENNEDLIHPLETNLANNTLEEGLNNDNIPTLKIQGGDNEEGTTTGEQVPTEKSDGDNEPDNEKIGSQKTKIENPETETIKKCTP